MERQMIRIAKIRFARLAVLGLSCALLPMLSAGCNDKAKHAKRDDAAEMHKPGDSVDRILEVQAGQAARADSTLYPQHFDSGELNSLGRTKLKLMMSGRETGQPVVVYMETGKAGANQAEARRAAIDKYWRDSTADAQAGLEIRDSANPALRYPAAQSLDRLNKTGSDAGNGGSAPADRGMTGGGTGVSRDTLFK
jgi:hypothetical protein